jgi:C-terminal peptidase prc
MGLRPIKIKIFQIALIGMILPVLTEAADSESNLSCTEFSSIVRFVEQQHLRFQQLTETTTTREKLFEMAKDQMPATLRLLGYPFLAAQFEANLLKDFRAKHFKNPDELCEFLSNSNYRGAFMKSFVKTLDPYSDFYLSEELETKSSVLDGDFIGVGIGTEPKVNALQVTEVVEGGPSDGKLFTGDLIYKIDGYPVSGLNEMEVRQRIRGLAKSVVKFNVQRDSKFLDVPVIRDHVRQKSVSFSWLKDNVLSIKISRFFKPTASEVEAILAENLPKARGIILDLRNNPGGLLQAARDVVDLFISQGVVVYLKGKNVEDQVWALRDGGHLTIPLVTLVNSGTASAAEIVAGALQDYGRALVVGQKTYGKGSVQNIYETQSAIGIQYHGGIKLTTLWYYLPSGRTVKSLDPDVKVAANDEEKVFSHPQMPYAGPEKIEVAQLPALGGRVVINAKKIERLAREAKSSEEAGQALLLEKWADFSPAHPSAQ